MKLIAICFATLAVVATAMARDLSFDSSNRDGLIVIGLVSGQEEEFAMRFARYNAETQEVSGRTTVDYEAPVDQMTYLAFRMEAGTHVFKSFHGHTEEGREIVFCMNQGTYAFDVRPGEAVYLGNFAVFGGGADRTMDPAIAALPKQYLIIVPSLKQLPPNLEAAKASLASYSGVTAELKSIELRPATFRSDRNGCG